MYCSMYGNTKDHILWQNGIGYFDIPQDLHISLNLLQLVHKIYSVNFSLNQALSDLG